MKPIHKICTTVQNSRSYSLHYCLASLNYSLKKWQDDSLGPTTIYTYIQCITNYLEDFQEIRKARIKAKINVSLISLKILTTNLVHLNFPFFKTFNNLSYNDTKFLKKMMINGGSYVSIIFKPVVKKMGQSFSPTHNDTRLLGSTNYFRTKICMVELEIGQKIRSRKKMKRSDNRVSHPNESRTHFCMWNKNGALSQLTGIP